MYYPYFVTYMLLGFIVTVPVFFWAMKSGQFRDQQRARFLPLEDEPLRVSPGGVARMKRIEVFALIFLAVAGLAASAGVLIFALFIS